MERKLLQHQTHFIPHSRQQASHFSHRRAHATTLAPGQHILYITFNHFVLTPNYTPQAATIISKWRIQTDHKPEGNSPQSWCKPSYSHKALFGFVHIDISGQTDSSRCVWPLWLLRSDTPGLISSSNNINNRDGLSSGSSGVVHKVNEVVLI